MKALCTKLALALFLPLAAAPAASLAQVGAAEIAEVRNYRLTMDKVNTMAKIYESASAAVDKTPKGRSLLAKEKEREALKDKRGAADQRRREQLDEEIEKLKEAIDEEFNRNAGGDSIADMTRAVERSPILSAAVRSAGMQAREFTVLQLALLNAVIGLEMQKSGQPLPKDVSPENVRFVQKNQAALQKLESRGKPAGER